MLTHSFRESANALVLVLAVAACETPVPETERTAAAAVVPGTEFVVDASWPKPLPNNWIFGQISGVAVDSRDHVWVIHRRSSLVESDTAALEQPPRSTCCTPAPSVVVFDHEGNVVRSWGGPGGELPWPLREHGIYVDATDHVWLGGSSPDGQVVRKFTLDGQLVLEIGVWKGKEAYSDREFESVLDALSVFAGDPLVAEPGTAFSYSTYGCTLLSAAMERGSRMPFLALVRERVLGPFT